MVQHCGDCNIRRLAAFFYYHTSHGARCFLSESRAHIKPETRKARKMIGGTKALRHWSLSVGRGCVSGLRPHQYVIICHHVRQCFRNEKNKISVGWLDELDSDLGVEYAFDFRSYSFVIVLSKRCDEISVHGMLSVSPVLHVAFPFNVIEINLWTISLTIRPSSTSMNFTYWTTPVNFSKQFRISRVVTNYF